MLANQGKIEGLRLTNFTCFADLEVGFSGGINVIIGENGLGKTHLLKAVFSSAKNQILGYESFQDDLLAALIGQQKMVKELKPNGDLTIATDFLQIFGGIGVRSLKKNLKKEFKVEIISSPNSQFDAVFLPIIEMLSWYKGFIPSFENRESSVDYVFYLLAKKLALLPLKGEKLEAQKVLIQELENGLGFEVIRDGDEFLIAFSKGQVHNTKLVANGINKLAQLIYLIMNGSLTKNSIIFWDEPEAGLNPKYIVLVAKFLQTLAKAGCQIFVATHDYLLSHTLSLAAEYRDVQPDTPFMLFHSLYKTPEGTQIESVEILPEIQHNSILDEYARFYKIEEDLFYKSMNVKE